MTHSDSQAYLVRMGLSPAESLCYSDMFIRLKRIFEQAFAVEFLALQKFPLKSAS